VFCQHVVIAVLQYTPWSIKTCHFYFLNSLMKHWPILIIFDTRHQERTWRKWLFGHLTFILSLHYLVTCRSHSLAIYNNESYWRAHTLAQKWLTEKRQTRLATIVSQKVAHDTSHFLLHYVLKMSSPRASASGKRWQLDTTCKQQAQQLVFHKVV